MTSRPDPLPESASYRFRHIRPTAATCPSRASLVTLITLLVGITQPLSAQDTLLARYAPPSGNRINVPGSRSP